MIQIDLSEPEEIVNLVQQSVDVSLEPLNQRGLSDYFFTALDGGTEQYSRKQAGELLSNMDEAERQIQSYYSNADRNYQIVEGIISPTRIPLKKKKVSVKFHTETSDILWTYHVALNGFIYGERAYKVSYRKYQSWLYQLDKLGVSTFFTMNYIQTARLLVAHYQNSQKLDHTTLRRYIKPKVEIRQHDPLVRALVHLSTAWGLKIGEAKATAIRDAGYTSVTELSKATIKELTQIDGIGRVLAKRLLQGLKGEYE